MLFHRPNVLDPSHEDSKSLPENWALWTKYEAFPNRGFQIHPQFDIGTQEFTMIMDPTYQFCNEMRHYEMIPLGKIDDILTIKGCAVKFIYALETLALVSKPVKLDPMVILDRPAISSIESRMVRSYILAAVRIRILNDDVLDAYDHIIRLFHESGLTYQGHQRRSDHGRRQQWATTS